MCTVKLYAKVAVTDERGRVLLLRRSISHPKKAGRWDLPGGVVDICRNEMPLRAGRREVLEETGLRLGTIRTLGTYTSPKNANGGYCMGILATAEVLPGQLVKLSHEHDMAFWVVPGLERDALLIGDLQPKYQRLLAQVVS